MIKEGSLSHHILSGVSRRHFGVAASVLHKEIGGNWASLTVQLCRHLKKGYIEHAVVLEGVQNHIERVSYRITNKGRDMLNQVGVYDTDEDDEPREAPDIAQVKAFTPNSIWDLSRTL